MIKPPCLTACYQGAVCSSLKGQIPKPTDRKGVKYLRNTYPRGGMSTVIN